MKTLRVRACLFPLILAGLFAFEAPRSLQAQDDKVITNSIGMKLTLIPAGKFMMGSPADEEERDPEELQHEVIITKPFYMGVYEVTQGQFERLMGKNKVVLQGKPGPSGGAVAFQRSRRFLQSLVGDGPTELEAGRKYRLPTEAEWEYACRAGADRLHFGDSAGGDRCEFQRQSSLRRRGQRTDSCRKRRGSAPTRPTRGAFTTCTATSRNGARIGTTPNTTRTARRKTRKARTRASSAPDSARISFASCAAAAGSTRPAPAEPRIAFGCKPPSRIGGSDCGWCASRESERQMQLRAVALQMLTRRG